MENQEQINLINNQQPFPVKKRHTLRKIILGAIVSLIILFVIFLDLPMLLNLFGHDIPPIDDSDIKLKKVVIADSDNGYFDLIKLKESIYYPKDNPRVINDMLDGKVAWDTRFAEELILKNSQSLNYYSNAASKNNIQYPLEADPVNMKPSMVLPNLSDWRTMSAISSIQAINLAKKGDVKGAIDESFKSIKIGQKIEDSNITLIEYLVGLAIKMRGLKTIENIINENKLTNQDALLYINELEKYKKSEKGVATAFMGEYTMQTPFLDTAIILQQLAIEYEGSLPDEKLLYGLKVSQFKEMLGNKFYFQPNKTKKLFADLTRKRVKNSYISCGDKEIVPIVQYTPKKLDYWTILFEQNLIGEILHDTIATGLDTVNIKKCEENALVGTAQIVLAIRAYNNDTKKYPEQLNDLIPKYLSSIPVDPFDKNPLKYSAVDKKIYSVHASSTYSFTF